MNLQQLKYFKIAAELENHTAAAKKLGITQSNLSHSIANLETELHVVLFEKQGRKIQISQKGKDFYQYVSEALSILEKGKEKMLESSAANQTTINIGHIHNTARDFIPQVIQQYRLLDHNVFFKLEQGTTSSLLEAMYDKNLDIILASKLDSDNLQGNIMFVPVYEEELVVIVSKQHRLAALTSIELTELDGESFIGYNPESGLHHLIFKALEENRVHVHITNEEILDSSICRMVSLGLGISIVPNTVDLLEYDLSVLSIKKKPIRRLIYLCWCSDRTFSKPVEKFINYIIHNYEIK